MEGGGDMKAMARAKRASSKRGRARHSTSKHKHVAFAQPGGRGGVGGDPAVPAAGAHEPNSVGEELPSNWERYSDGSGSEDEPIADGVVRPKSKGADYSELLSSDVPKLYEDLPELEGIPSMLLDPTFGLWEGDTWLEPPSASEQQTARDAAALLSVDLGLLGKSLSRLHIAERLMMEDMFFPKQESKPHDSEVDKLELENTAKVPTIPASKTLDQLEAASSPAYDGRTDLNHQSDSAPDGVTRPPNPSSMETSTLSVSQGGPSPSRNGVLEERSRLVVRTFVPTAAEAELDDLLDMLDNQAASAAPNTITSRNTTGNAFSPNFSFASSTKAGPQVQKISLPPMELSRLAGSGNSDSYLAPTVAVTTTSKPGNPYSKEVKSSTAVAIDDDFDSWLDSI